MAARNTHSAKRLHQRQSRFLKSLKKDLICAGFHVRGSGANGSSWKVSTPAHHDQEVRIRDLRRQQILAAREFISRMEAAGVLNDFGDGSSINISTISPVIRFCESTAEHRIFCYGKFFQRVPTTNRVGRQLRALVYDTGQVFPILMGMFELASGTYTLGCRDEYLGWGEPSKRAIKERGLRRIMDLASVVALPPYNLLFGGKLMAALALSDTVRREYERRYKSALLGLVATSATGLHCAILNRIGLKPGGLYRRIGATTGYSTLFISPHTLSEARRFLPRFTSAPEGEFSVSVRPLHVLRTALRSCGIAPDRILRSAYPKGVYFGTISDKHIVALREGRTVTGPGLPLDAIVDYWRDRYLAKAVADHRRVADFLAHRRCGPIS